MLKKKSFLERITGSMRFEDEKDEESVVTPPTNGKKLSIGEKYKDEKESNGKKRKKLNLL